MLSRHRQAEVMVSTSAAMTASTFQLFLIAVLAATIIDELGIGRWQLGVLGAVNTGVGALTAPRLGRVADRLGARRSMVLLFVVSAAGLLATAVATSFGWLVVASCISGVPQGASNPVTNKLIAEQVPARQQSPVMGVKQSGVQLAVFLSGATMPSAAATFGWRWAVAIAAAITLALAAVVALRADHGAMAPETDAPVPSEAGTTGRPPTRGFVNQVALYAFLMGLCAGGVTRFYPLYANEVLGYSEAVAGVSVSIAGVAAIVARLVWAQAVNTRVGLRLAMAIMALGSVVTIAMLFMAESGAPWLLWPAVLGLAFTIAAWNVVAMLAVIRTVPRAHAGGATGIVLLGFLGGLTISAPLVGYSIDVLDSYRPAWLALAALALAAAVVVIGRRVRLPSPQPGR